jgi:hypothetical protein
MNVIAYEQSSDLRALTVLLDNDTTVEIIVDFGPGYWRRVLAKLQYLGHSDSDLVIPRFDVWGYLIAWKGQWLPGKSEADYWKDAI